MKRSLLSIVRCPDCHGKLDIIVDRESRGEIEEGSLRCCGCGLLYPILEFVPRFVTSDYYARSFSVEWNTFSTTQLDRGLMHNTRETFVQKVGIQPCELEGKLTLEAGCGMGRFLDIVSKKSSATVVGFDLSLAVDAAFRNLGSRPNVHIVQADILRPPFGEGMFDFIFSIGVLHHTRDPLTAFGRLVSLLKEDGEIAIWVYLRSRIPLLSDFYRIFTRRMPLEMVMNISRVLSRFYVINKQVRYFRWLVPISLESDPERRLLDTFDWYSPKYQFKFRTDEVVRWFKQMALHDIHVGEFPVSVRGRK